MPKRKKSKKAPATTKKKKSVTRRKARKKTTGKKPSGAAQLKGSYRTPFLASAEQRRQHSRIPLKIKIDYFKDPGVFLYDYSRNLGRGGIFIESKEPLPPGTELHLSFTLPDQSEPVEVKGKVTWILKPRARKGEGVPGMGVQFDNPEGRYKEALDRFFREIDYDNLNF